MMKKTLLYYNKANDRPLYLGWSIQLLVFMMLLVGPNVLANNEFSEIKPHNFDLFAIDGGTITGGPFEFCVGDGIADNVAGVELECNNTVNSQWVVTSPEGTILGLPPSPEAVNFD